MPGCPRLLTHGSRCDEHQQAHERHDAHQRGTATERGYDRQWRAEAAEYRRQHPWCERCLKLGRRVPTAIVDHVIAITDGGKVHGAAKQALCRHCHGLKTAAEVRARR